jgi:hypothetical protein
MAVMRDTGESRLAEESGQWRASFAVRVRFPELNGSVCGTGKKLSFWGPTNILDDIAVSPHLPYLLS